MAQKGGVYAEQTYRAGLHDLAQGQVHPSITLHQVAVECLAILELNQHRVALRRSQKAEGQLERKQTVSLVDTKACRTILSLFGIAKGSPS